MPLVVGGIYLLIFGIVLRGTIVESVGDVTDVIWARIIAIPWSFFVPSTSDDGDGESTAVAIAALLNAVTMYFIVRCICVRIAHTSK